MKQNLFTPRGVSDSPLSSEERLDSWKEVASFFRREVRTVQLWEKNEGLPVRRQHHKKLGSVYAYRSELERWWATRSAMGVAQVGRAGEAATSLLKTPVGALKPLQTDTAHLLVLPSEVIHSSSDRESTRKRVQAFSEGLSEDLIVELSRRKLHTASLPSRSMPLMTKVTSTFLKTLAAEFEADLLLSSSIRFADDRIRVSVRVIRAGDLRCLWSDRFDIGLASMLDTQVSLALQIGQALSEHVNEIVALAKRNPDVKQGIAHHACMLGLHFWGQRSRTAIQKAFTCFQEAVEVDPTCAAAFAGLANTYISLSYNHLMAPRRAAMGAAETVKTALRLDPNSIAARNARINLLTNCEWDWASAEMECRELIDAGLADSRTIQLFSSLMNAQGRHDEAIGLALSSNRLEPLSVAANTQVSMAYFYGGDYDSAVPFIRRSLEIAPQYTMGYALLGRIESQRGNWDDAVSAFRRALDLSNESQFAQALLAYGYAGSGDATKASEILKDVHLTGDDACFPAYDVSAAHALLNQEEQALQNISRAYETRDMKTIFVNHDPRFARLRSFPGFDRVAAAMSFG
jgi:TolB-like protein/lipopolysaccharide biosynthesis regulator YciM